MKQGAFITKLVIFVIVAAVSVYMVLQITGAMDNPIRTQEASLFNVEESFRVGGYLIREEITLPSEAGIPVMLVGEGERASKGETVAEIYDNAYSFEKNAALKSLDERITLLEHAKNRVGETTPNSSLEEDIISSLSELSRLRNRQSFTRLDEFSASLKSLILRRGYAYADEAEINRVLSALKSERRSLSEQVSSVTKSVTTDRSGTFSSAVDGYETVLYPDMIKSLTPTTFAAIPSLKQNALGMGKIVSGFFWYYTVTLEKDTVDLIKNLSSVNIRFSSIGENISMRIYYISEPENDRCVVTFRSQDYLSQTVLLREQQTEIIYKSHSGIKVPREAIRFNEKNEIGVYCVEVREAVFKPVEIIYEKDNYYIAYYNKDKPTALRPGDEIITAAKDLFHGKVLM